MVSRKCSVLILVLISIGIPAGLIFLWIYEVLPYEIVIGITSLLLLGGIVFAIKYLPTLAPASISRLELLMRIGEYDQAIEILTKRLNKGKEKRKDLINLSVVYSLKGEHEMSIETLNRLLKLRPYDSVALYNLSTTYNDQGKYKKAIDILLKLVNEVSRDLPKKDYELWFEIAEIYAKKGDLVKALEWLDKILNLRPKFSDALKLHQQIKSGLARNYESNM